MSKFIVGLTGGIGAGKTAVSDRFAGRGITIIDADLCAREVVKPGTAALSQIKAHFGETLILDNGELNRVKLRELVFTNPSHQMWLNNLLHPLIRERMLAQIETACSAYCVLVVPLLLENNMQSLVNRILVVDVDVAEQVRRVVTRDDTSEALVHSIIATQIERNSRLKLADDIIDNRCSLEQLDNQVSQLHEQYLILAARSQ